MIPVISNVAVMVTDTADMVKDDAIKRTRDTLTEIASGLAQFRASTSTLPSSLKELQIHFGAGRIPHLSDAWGTEIYYETDGINYALQSAGPDRNFDTDSDNVTIIKELGSHADDNAKKRQETSIMQERLSLLKFAQDAVGFEFGKSYNLFNICGIEEKTDTTISYRHDLQPTNAITLIGITGIKNMVVTFDLISQTASSISFVSQEYGRAEAFELIELCRKNLKQYDIDDSKWPTIPVIVDHVVVKFADMKLKEGISMMFYCRATTDKFTFVIDIIDMNVLKAICNGSGFVPESKLPPLMSLFNISFGENVTNVIDRPVPQDGPPGVLYYTFTPKIPFFSSDYYVCTTRRNDNRIFGVSCAKLMSKEDTCLLVPRIVATLEEKYKRKFTRSPNKKNYWEMCFYDKNRNRDGYYVASKFIRLSMEEVAEGKMLVTVTAVDEKLKPSPFAADASAIKAL